MIINNTDSCGSSAPPSDSTRFLANLADVEVTIKDASSEVKTRTEEMSFGEALASVKNPTVVEWLEFTIHYPILEISSEVGSKKKAYKIANEVVKKAIDDKTFTNQLRWWNAKIMAAANVGEEPEIFYPWTELWGSWTSTSYVNATAAKVYEPLNPKVLHPIRLAGMSLLGATIFFVTCLLLLARQRKRDREREEEEMRRGQRPLCTNEGLNEMLEVGRNVTLRRRLNQDA